MRIALGIEYDGTDFQGWQRLSHGATVQASVEQALSFVAAQSIEVTCAGRTDAGVHGRCQVVHFDTQAQRDLRGWVLGASSNLPASVAVLWAKEMPDDFHARFSARSRRYRYTLLNRTIRPALDARYVAWERHPLDAEQMHAAAQALIGEHDFSAFRAVSCQAAHARREVKYLSVWRTGEQVIVEIEANAFLHHMVRNIVGSLLLVGRGEQPAAWIAQLLAGRNREVAGPTAAASGLTFIGPRYERHWGLPEEMSV
ncbi:tRNA pseudouridine(38-40) synthase TruA [Dyella flagellata]|uniref:tRNA pseudouridine synthase A n=1 Tax=Dyella flagellata TaxID=1867833 RepID=A0ABQ5XBD5_9GAMM|nr:tRNA pseudouridine(38-40) synthase TruA [Dyella flagellata]GLQ89006.1 tRNA pseudouridine synthase A [Dyella flagellata]